MNESTNVHVAEIVDSRWQTRQDGYSGPEFDELVASVREHGIVNPPGVFINEGEQYELVYGHRRLAAGRKAGLTMVPVTILENIEEAGPDGQKQLDRFQQMVIADNLYHEDLTPLELAEALKDLITLQNLSQKQVAEMYGKSQQWVSDKLRLLDLAPEVQEAVTARAVEETVARKLAQLPQSYQAPVAKYVEGRASRDAINIIQDIEKAADPVFWDLPGDKPWSPERMNVQAMMLDCLEKVPHEQMGKVLVALSKSYQLMAPDRASSWGLDLFAKACGVKKETLAEWQLENGRDCETCVFAGEGLYRDCSLPRTKTCEHCLIAIDPVRLPYPDSEGECSSCVGEGHWCTDISCYILTLKAVRERNTAAAQEEDLEETVAMLELLRAFYDRQLLEDVDRGHWLAQACEHCLHFQGPEPREQCGLEEAEYVATAFWQSEEIVVPRCSAFGLKDASRIPEIDQACFDEILLGWLAAAGSKVAAFIPGKDGEERVAYLRGGHLNRKQLVALLGYAAHPDVTQTWIEKAELANPITGEKSLWTKVETAG